MARGAPTIYCDLVDYDEVAHHAGPARPESMRQLESLDRMLGVLERLAPEAARRYHLVVLSDHGQSQGSTFRQRWGETLKQVVDRFSAPDVAAAPSAPAEAEATTGPEFPVPPTAPLLVVPSGNLALLYLTRFQERLCRTQIAQVYPRLVEGLAAHPGIGVVVVADDDGPVAVGRYGVRHLRDGRIEGIDPLIPYGEHGRADLLRHQESAHVGDLVLISAVDPVTHEVAAFEELVGSHGGLGGWQTDAMLVHPSDWPVAQGDLVGPDAVHRQLVEWLAMLGLRTQTPAANELAHSSAEPARPAVEPAHSSAEPARPAVEPARPAVEPARPAAELDAGQPIPADFAQAAGHADSGNTSAAASARSTAAGAATWRRSP
jgi:hypothetical protein